MLIVACMAFISFWEAASKPNTSAHGPAVPTASRQSSGSADPQVLRTEPSTSPSTQKAIDGRPVSANKDQDGSAPQDAASMPQQQHSTPLTVTFAQGNQGNESLKVRLEKQDSSLLKDSLPSIISLIAVLVSFFAVWSSQTHNKRTLIQKAREDDIRDIQEKLNSFYGPFRQLLTTSRNLYRLFSLGKPHDFRTLVALIEGKVFHGNDAVLLREIVDVTQKIDRLIMEKSGLIDESLQPLMAQASTHFRLMLLASKGELHGDTDRFTEDVFPRELGQKIDAEIERLRSRRDQLRRLDGNGIV